MQLNTQAPEPHSRGDGYALDVHSIFHTIQGEGPFSGRPAVFVRLAGCNLQCPGCDTEYTQGRAIFDAQVIMLDILRVKQGSPTSLVVITGGEPLRQNLVPLVRYLVQSGHTVQIESNGVFGISDELLTFLQVSDVHLVVSPKTSRVHETMRYASAFKYVLQDGEVDPDDHLPLRALGHKAAPKVARPPAGYKGPIYVNPMDEKDDARNAANIRVVKGAAMLHGYTLGLQIHKLIGVE